MSIEEIVVEKIRKLPPRKQQEVLEFVESLKKKKKTGPLKPLRSAEGLWADLGFEITEEDIAEARREMWGGFQKSTES